MQVMSVVSRTPPLKGMGRGEQMIKYFKLKE